MNIIILSPHFPHYHWLYCDRLRRQGVNVLGIADVSYESLLLELRGCLTEYYRVDNLANYEALVRAVAYFIHQYGRIDGIYSHNEFWLETEARLRTDFNIPGIKFPDVLEFKKKSLMKKHFQDARVKVSRWKPVDTLEKALRFAEKVGYPLVIKPDVGVGALRTWDIPFIMEEYVPGDIVTYDGIADDRGRVVFSTSHYFPHPMMDVVLDNSELHFCSEDHVPEDLERAGCAAVRELGARSQFFHLEFFRLTGNKPGLAKKGHLVALESNMRPPGGHMVDMINFAHDMDAYDLWARVVAGKRPGIRARKPLYFCGYASRKACYPYRHTDTEIRRLLGEQLLLQERVPAVLARAMGDILYIFRSTRREDIDKWTRLIQEKGPVPCEVVR